MRFKKGAAGARLRKAETTGITTYSTQTGFVSEVQGPNTLLRDTVFGSVQVMDTEKLEVSTIMGGRVIAPFVMKNGSALLVSGTVTKTATVEAPNIRTKMTFDPAFQFVRKPGVVNFATAAQIGGGYAEYKQRELAYMTSMHINAEEWQAAMAIGVGVIAYTVDDEEAFTISNPKPAANNVVVTILWDDPDPSLPTPDEDFYTAKRLLNAQGTGHQPNIALFGQAAAAAFRHLMVRQDGLDRLYVNSGRIDLTTQFDVRGAIFMGTFCGIPCWEYTRAATLNGVSVPMIRSKFVEFIAAVPESEFKRYYAAIPEVVGDREILARTMRFSKEWSTPDPAATYALVHSRPLCYARRPGASASFQVTA